MERKVSSLGSETESWYTGSNIFEESSLTSYNMESPEVTEEGNLIRDAEIHMEDSEENTDIV